MAEKAEENALPIPEVAKPWYRGKRVAKYSLAASDFDSISATIKALRQEYGAGARVLLEAQGEVPAEQIITVAKAATSGSETPLALNTLLQGVECGEGGADCPGIIPVVYSGVAVPSSRNLTEEPEKKVVAPKPPPAPKAPPASAKFCDKGDIQKVMKGKKGKFKFCYERQLQMYPELQGKVKVQFVIPEGQTKASSVKIASSELKNEKVHACLKKTIRKLNFNKPDGGSCAVSWPFVFK